MNFLHLSFVCSCEKDMLLHQEVVKLVEEKSDEGSDQMKCKMLKASHVHAPIQQVWIHSFFLMFTQGKSENESLVCRKYGTLYV